MLFDNGLGVRRALVLPVEVVRVLPDVDDEKRLDAGGSERRVGVRRRFDGELSALRDEPCPAAADAPRQIAIRYSRLCIAGKCICSDIMPPSCAEPLHQAKHGKSIAKDAQILLFRILRKQRLRHHRLDLRQLRLELAHNSAHGFFIQAARLALYRGRT